MSFASVETNRGNAFDRFSLGGILSLLVGESLMIALSGGAIGCGVAFGLFKVFALNADALALFLITCSGLCIGGDPGRGGAYRLFSAYVPARAAAKRSIVETLRLVD